jgi:hypothetical protein
VGEEPVGSAVVPYAGQAGTGEVGSPGGISPQGSGPRPVSWTVDQWYDGLRGEMSKWVLRAGSTPGSIRPRR